ncbi:MAG: lipase family protein [Gordonia sp. (in: high G+C Gram-positive bacteria)]
MSLRKIVVVFCAFVVGVIPLLVGPQASAAPGITAKAGAGDLVDVTDITDTPNARIKGAAKVYLIHYLSENERGRLIPVRGTVSIPAAKPYAGPYRFASWAHGTAGLGDDCTVTDRMGTKVNGVGRWDAWMGPWFTHGYVLVASEYAGIGGPGVHAYNDGQMQGKNIIDAVRAARAVVARHGDHAAGTAYTTAGGSQGGLSSVWAAKLADTYAPELNLVGASAQSVPVDISASFAPIAPGVPPVSVTDFVTYFSYVLAGVKVVRPDVDVDSYLTPLGRKVVRDAQTLCYPNQGRATRGLTIGQLVSRPFTQGPLLAAVRSFTKAPGGRLGTRLLIQQGTLDPVAPAEPTTQWVDSTRAAGSTVDYRTYNAGHGINLGAQRDSLEWAFGLPWPRG